MKEFRLWSLFTLNYIAIGITVSMSTPQSLQIAAVSVVWTIYVFCMMLTTVVLRTNASAPR